MNCADDVVDRIEKAWVLGEELVDVAAGPRFTKSLRGKATTDPCSADAPDRAIDLGVTAFDSERSDRGWVEPTRCIGVCNHGIAILQGMLRDECVVQECSSRNDSSNVMGLGVSGCGWSHAARALGGRATVGRTNIGPDSEIAESTDWAIGAAFFDKFHNSGDKAGIGTDRGSPAHGHAKTFRGRFSFRVEIEHHFHVIGDESNGNDDYRITPGPGKGFEVIVDVGF